MMNASVFIIFITLVLNWSILGKIGIRPTISSALNAYIMNGESMNTEKERSFLIHIFYWLTILTLLTVLFRYVLYQILPFLLGFFIAFSLRPAIRRTAKHLPFPQKLISGFYLLLFYGTIGLAIALLCIACFRFLSAFIVRFPALYETQIAPLLNQLFLWVENELQKLPLRNQLDLQPFFTQMAEAIKDWAITSSAALFSLVRHAATSLPSMIVAFFITLLSSIFFTMDFPRIAQFIMRQIPRTAHADFYHFRHIVTDTILHYFCAYGKLMVITFLELAVGLTLLKVEYAVPIAFCISFFDIFPILGTGTILYPWILISFFHRQIKLAVGLIILHLVINLIRQIIEPKIVGKQLGIHPLLMLGCMFFGMKWFGLLGIFITPILVQIFCQLNEEGYLHLYR